MVTYTLQDAATFLNIHFQTLREKAIKGIIPGAKIGKSWVFIEEDLVTYLRSQYASPAIGERQGLNEMKEVACHSINVEKSTGLNLLRQRGKQYAALLGLPRKR
ncbi:MAG: helix-turn-helix domain-containing protein [Proteobacteria bacterium]|nr:helix-turn-helix domain-containing protein [Pseudomonadota bacterium]